MDGIKILLPQKDDILRRIVFLAVEGSVAVKMSFQPFTITLTKEVFSIALSIIIALLAMVFTGYVFSQVLINDDLLITLMEANADEEESFYGLNQYFVRLMILYIAIIILDFALIVFMIILPEDWILCQNNNLNEAFSALGLIVIFYVNVESVWEVKSLFFSIYQLFSLSAVTRILNINKERIENSNYVGKN